MTSIFGSSYEDHAGRIVLPQEDSHISAVYVTDEVTLKDGKIRFADSNTPFPYDIRKGDLRWRQIFFFEVRYTIRNPPEATRSIVDLVNDFLKTHTYKDEDIVEKIAKRWGPLWTTKEGSFYSQVRLNLKPQTLVGKVLKK